MNRFLKSIFGGGRSAEIPRPLPPEEWPSVINSLCSQRDRVDNYLIRSVLPYFAQFYSSMFDKHASVNASPTILNAFFANRALTLVSDLQYVSPQYGNDFADALCGSLYGNESFRACPHLSACFSAEDNPAVREYFARQLAGSFDGQGTAASIFIYPFALKAAIDMDYLCLPERLKLLGIASMFKECSNSVRSSSRSKADLNVSTISRPARHWHHLRANRLMDHHRN